MKKKNYYEKEDNNNNTNRNERKNVTNPNALWSRVSGFFSLRCFFFFFFSFCWCSIIILALSIRSLIRLFISFSCVTFWLTNNWRILVNACWKWNENDCWCCMTWMLRYRYSPDSEQSAPIGCSCCVCVCVCVCVPSTFTWGKPFEFICRMNKTHLFTDIL